MYDALCIANNGAVLCGLSFPHAVVSFGRSPVKIRNAMFMCSYVNFSGARPTTTESWLYTFEDSRTSVNSARAEAEVRKYGLNHGYLVLASSMVI